MSEVSVVVPAVREGERLESTLDSLAVQTEEPLEVIVVAAGESTLEVARAHPIVDHALVDDREDGPGYARNRGAKAARGDILCFTDADTVVPPAWVARHRRHYVTPEVVGVGGPLRPLEGGLPHRFAFRVLSDWWYRVSWPMGFLQQPGPNCSVRREAFEAIGGFDEALPFLEDTDLSLRLGGEGTVVYDHTCPVSTSTRRQRREGYVGLFLTYLLGYLQYALPGLEPTRGYFRR